MFAAAALASAGVLLATGAEKPPTAASGQEEPANPVGDTKETTVEGGDESATESRSDPVEDGPFIACWTAPGGVKIVQAEPDECYFVRIGGESAADGLPLRGINWQDWGSPTVRGEGEFSRMGSTTPFAIELSKLQYQERCGVSLYTQVTLDGTEGPNTFRINGCEGGPNVVPPNMNNAKLPVPADAELCGNLDAGYPEFTAFHITAKGVSCAEAVGIVMAVLNEGGPLQPGWSCESFDDGGMNPHQVCTDGSSRVEFD